MMRDAHSGLDVSWSEFFERFQEVYKITDNANASVNLMSLFYGLKMADEREDWQK